jgi:membrane-bound serine protease (ClpP class)
VKALLGAALLAVTSFALLAVACADDTPDGAVHVLRADTEVGPIMERYIDRGIGRAEDSHAKLVVIELDTPGGLDTSMRDIVQRIERAKVPVAVYVAPSGSRAASAGTFITMAANIAAMAPNTSIGAASAINSDGSDIGGTLGKKVENDAVAFIRGIAELRGRNADWAESAVRDAVAVNQSSAIDLHVVDFVANDLADLLRQAEGRTLSLQPGNTVQLQGLTAARVVHTDMTAWERILVFIADPTLASLLITIGFFGIIFELANPGLIFPGVVGAIAMVLGFIGLGVLPVDTAGLVLIALGLLLFAIELFVQSGFLSAGAIVALILGGIIAFRDTPSELRPSGFLLGIVGFLVAAIIVSLGLTIARVRKASTAMGTAALIGKVAIARTALAPEGFVFVQGERWQAELERGHAQEGDRVRIVGAQGLRLLVRQEEEK